MTCYNNALLLKQLVIINIVPFSTSLSCESEYLLIGVRISTPTFHSNTCSNSLIEIPSHCHIYHPISHLIHRLKINSHLVLFYIIYKHMYLSYIHRYRHFYAFSIYAREISFASFFLVFLSTKSISNSLLSSTFFPGTSTARSVIAIKSLISF